jgi:hypothetical protein
MIKETVIDKWWQQKTEFIPRLLAIEDWMQEMEVIETSDALLCDDATEQALMSQERDMRHESNSMEALREFKFLLKEAELYEATMYEKKEK